MAILPAGVGHECMRSTDGIAKPLRGPTLGLQCCTRPMSPYSMIR